MERRAEIVFEAQERLRNVSFNTEPAIDALRYVPHRVDKAENFVLDDEDEHAYYDIEDRPAPRHERSPRLNDPRDWVHEQLSGLDLDKLRM